MTVANTAPVLESVSIAPASPKKADTLVATPVASDADGDPLSYTYEWFKNTATTKLAGESTSSLTVSQHGGKGDTFRVEVVANDGTASSERKSDSVTVANTAPAVAGVTASADAVEGAPVTITAAASDVDGDSLTYAIDCGGGVYSTPGASTSLQCTFADNGSPSVSVRVSDGTAATSSSVTVAVANVGPSATLQGPASALTGRPVTVTGSATDPSSADRSAGFTWAFDTGAGFSQFSSTSSSSSTYSTCGSKQVSAKAADKDGGVSAVATHTTQVYDGRYLAPLSEGTKNSIQRGRVVPVQVSFGCGGHMAGLKPAIEMLKGDYDETASATSDATVVTTSASSADTTGVMREVDSKYMYNLQTPSTATVGSLYTVRVWPFGLNNGPSMKVLLEMRK